MASAVAAQYDASDWVNSKYIFNIGILVRTSFAFLRLCLPACEAALGLLKKCSRKNEPRQNPQFRGSSIAVIRMIDQSRVICAIELSFTDSIIFIS